MRTTMCEPRGGGAQRIGGCQAVTVNTPTGLLQHGVNRCCGSARGPVPPRHVAPLAALTAPASVLCRQCDTGPLLRQLAANSSCPSGVAASREAPSKEGAAPLAAALACQGSSASAVAFALERGSVEGTLAVERSSFAAAPAEALPCLPAAPAGGAAAAPSSLVVGPPAPLPTRPGAAARAGAPAPLGVGTAAARRLLQADAPEEIAIYAGPQYLAALQLDGGTLDLQLLDHASDRAWDSRTLAKGARRVAAAWDADGEGGQPVLLVCWLSGGAVPLQDATGFRCAHVGLPWMMEGNGLGLAGSLAVVLGCVLVALCCLRTVRCSALGAHARALAARLSGVRSAASARASALLRRPSGRPRVRGGGRQHARELRAQLAQLGPVGALDGEGGGAAADEGRAPGPAAPPAPGPPAEPQGTCGVCRCPVAIWVAFRPCGHTACRDCVAQLVDSSQRCNVCRQEIEGVLPVYL
ncbi:unnamed protein product [Prorocentrum cordatum]|uniref:RING-type domain-containing protein n=1 Tax=Prorocentrum cordatum TaxID=2364126 RepID=A0ABN9Y7N9_9DINO|nr:unnamed protein product [Polarella glacialis]